MLYLLIIKGVFKAKHYSFLFFCLKIAKSITEERHSDMMPEPRRTHAERAILTIPLIWTIIRFPESTVKLNTIENLILNVVIDQSRRAPVMIFVFVSLTWSMSLSEGILTFVQHPLNL